MPGATHSGGADMSIADASERARALDVHHSFCVTAPAGSGKTELLIQRYLALLGRVERPEQVLAITFTRKAAAEMRERVLEALQQALEQRPCESEHQRVTRQLAEAALQRSVESQWHLTRDVSRLNIKTIDSFCAGLTRQMPILSRFGGQAQAVDNAAPLYQEAVAELFALTGSSRPESKDLASLLLHFDNNWDRLGELLVTMLGKRDQWHEYMGANRSPDEAEQRLLTTVQSVVTETLVEVAALLDPWQDEIYDLLCYSRANMGETVPAEFPTATADAMEDWRAVGQLFLTQTGSFRKTVNVRNGFPAGKGEEADRKAHFKDLVSRMSAVPGLAAELQSLAWLPDMGDNSDSWQLVLHLSHVLPLLAACLLLVFERRGVVDHTQVALSALDALGEDDAPTELALRLDYSIDHILVDEFQDTAINQYRLVSRLTRGWGQHNEINPGAARTIFIVGDGMQSIYGFRNANVGLFLKAQQEGFNGVVPHALALRCNFRSQQNIVDWINDSFLHAFPSEDNVRRGRVSFTDAVAVKPALPEPAISLNGFYGEQAAAQEAGWLVTQLEIGMADPALESIAILGRSRAQLMPIMELLRARAIPFAAQEMDQLAGSPTIVDLLSLCKGLANPADRVAWFSILRAPWCALSLADLHTFAHAHSHRRYLNVPGLLLSGNLPEGLSKEGHDALLRLGNCLRWAQGKRDRLALRVWIEQLWLRLGGPAALPHARFLPDAQRFFELLQQAEQDGVGFDMDWLSQRIERLYASGDTPEAKLQIMTLHKAKGLEFDWVIIPALARATRGDSRDILLWDEHNSPDGERGFLLAADDHSDDKTASLYNYLKRQRREKTRLESTRLLYVGATRAINKLTLSACLKGGENLQPGDPVTLNAPPAGSLIAPIWPVFETQMTLHEAQILPAQEPGLQGRINRLLNPPPVAAGNEVKPDEDPNIPVPAFNRVDRHVGTAIHQALEALSLEAQLPHTIPASLQRQVCYSLGALGLWNELQETALQRVLAAVQRTLDDEEAGRWLLSSHHPQAHSELALTRNREGQPQDIVIDRTFLDDKTGMRWVVDYKSSAPAEGVSLEVFTREEAARYRQQMCDYRDSVATMGAEPVRCALYFTSLALLHPLPELDL